MGGGLQGLFDLEQQFAFYGAYHRNKINILIHIVFVWPILFSLMVLQAYTQPLAPQLPILTALPFHEYMLFNYSFLTAAVYATFYITLEPKSGSIGAFMVLACWVGANAVAQNVPFSYGWKMVLVAQVVCWTSQIAGHGVFEKRAPAFLDNIAQAFLMAPYFVLLEVLHLLFNFEPYPGFTNRVTNKVNANIAASKNKRAE